MRDPYAVLGVPRTADAAAIKAAYRRLAKAHHPDRHPGDAAAERRFKEISAAYALLSDPERRRRFDAGEINADGQEQVFRGFRAGRGGGGAGGGFGGFEQVFERAFGGGGRGGRGFSGAGIDEILNELFGGGGRTTARGRGAAGGGAQHRTFGAAGPGPGGAAAGGRGARATGGPRQRLEVDFLAAIRGGRQRVTLPDGRTLEVNLPPGTEDGQVLRLKGQAPPGSGAAGPGSDVLVEVAVRPHPRLTRKGRDIHVELPVSLPEAVLGAKVTVPTIDGPVRLAVPPGSNSGATLRLRGRGVPSRDGGGDRGDQYVRLIVMLPERPDPELTAFVRRWSEAHGYDVRAGDETDAA